MFSWNKASTHYMLSLSNIKMSALGGHDRRTKMNNKRKGYHKFRKQRRRWTHRYNWPHHSPQYLATLIEIRVPSSSNTTMITYYCSSTPPWKCVLDYELPRKTVNKWKGNRVQKTKTKVNTQIQLTTPHSTVPSYSSYQKSESPVAATQQGLLIIFLGHLHENVY
jgi:hypothetical protein